MAKSTIGDLLDHEVAAANAAADRRERCLDQHGYGCARPECGRSRGVISGLDIHARTLARARP